MALNDGKNDEAIRLAEAALKENPGDIGGLALLSIACIWAGYDDRWELELRRLRQLTPQSDTERVLMAYTLGQADPPKAKELLEKVLFHAAKEILARDLGYPETPASDDASGFVFPGGVIAPIRYWYRLREGPLVAAEFKSRTFQPLASFAKVELDQPAWGDPGDLGVELDAQGRLLWFRAIPKGNSPERQRDVPDGPTITAEQWRTWFRDPAVPWDSLSPLPPEETRSPDLPIPPDPFDTLPARTTLPEGRPVRPSGRGPGASGEHNVARRFRHG